MWSTSAEKFDLCRYMQDLRKGKKMSTLRKGTVIFSEGDEDKSIFFVLEGTVKLTVTSSVGKEAIVGIVDGGFFFGESCIMNGRSKRSYRAVALSNVRLAELEGAAMIHLLQTNHDVLYCFLVHVIHTIQSVQDNLASSLLYPASQRLARILVSLSQLADDSHIQHSFPQLGQEELAEMIGATRQHVNAQLMKFKESGHIQYKRGLKSFRVNKSMSEIAGLKTG
jgi:CRP/FNR family transcriptional regulator, cyclic AMP receptor protein